MFVQITSSFLSRTCWMNSAAGRYVATITTALIGRPAFWIFSTAAATLVLLRS
jgi:hypothetical protein